MPVHLIWLISLIFTPKTQHGQPSRQRGREQDQSALHYVALRACLVRHRIVSLPISNSRS